MQGVIRFFDPKEKPFGSLSNNYFHIMRLGGADWRTVTQYVYGMALNVPYYRNQIRQVKNLKWLG